jgi:hypothetical protein
VGKPALAVLASDASPGSTPAPEATVSCRLSSSSLRANASNGGEAQGAADPTALLAGERSPLSDSNRRPLPYPFVARATSRSRRQRFRLV